MPILASRHLLRINHDRLKARVQYYKRTCTRKVFLSWPYRNTHPYFIRHWKLLITRMMKVVQNICEQALGWTHSVPMTVLSTNPKASKTTNFVQHIKKIWRQWRTYDLEGLKGIKGNFKETLGSSCLFIILSKDEEQDFPWCFRHKVAFIVRMVEPTDASLELSIWHHSHKRT